MYEERSNGTHAVKCDSPQCHIEIIAPSRAEAFEDVNLSGWKLVGQDRAGENMYACSHCAAGQHPGAAVARAMLGGDEVVTEAPSTVRKGDAIHTVDGTLVGHYAEDGEQGEPVKVKVVLPSVSAKFAVMMQGTEDGDDEAVEKVAADCTDEEIAGIVKPLEEPEIVAIPPEIVEQLAKVEQTLKTVEKKLEASEPPIIAQIDEMVATAKVEQARVQAPEPEPGSEVKPRRKPKRKTTGLEALPGDTGGGGVVQRAPGVDTSSPEVQEAMRRAPTAPRGPKLNEKAIADLSEMFKDVYTTWDPDGE